MPYKKIFLFFLALTFFSLGNQSDQNSDGPQRDGSGSQKSTENTTGSGQNGENPPSSCNDIKDYNPEKHRDIESTLREIDLAIDSYQFTKRSKENIINQVRVSPNPSRLPVEELENEIETIETHLKKCRDIKENYERALSKLKKCTEKWEEATKAHKEFSKDCADFLGGALKCSEAIVACSKCPDEEDHGDYDCVRIHNKTKCPAKSGKELKSAKKKRDKVSEEEEELREEIRELEEDIVSKENDLNKDLEDLENEFIEARKGLERETEEEKENLEDQLKKTKAAISSAVSESIAKVQGEIDNSLKVIHSVENAITKANMKYRNRRREIVMECEVQAQARLAKYRERRRAAIQTGSLKISLTEMFKRGRTTFGQKDASLLKKYNFACLAKRKRDFQEENLIYRQELRVIEQQRQQYETRLEKARQSILSLSSQASQEQAQLVQEYTKNMNKILEKHQKEFHSAAQSYMKAKQGLLLRSKNITVLKKHLREQKMLLEDKQRELIREEELIAYLKAKGVTEDSDDEFSSAAGSHASLDSAVRIAESACECEGDKSDNSKDKCGTISKYKEDLTLEDEYKPVDSDTFSPSSSGKQ